MLLIYLLGVFVCPPTQFIVFHFFLKTISEISNNNGIFNTRILLMIFNCIKNKLFVYYLIFSCRLYQRVLGFMVKISKHMN